TPCSCAASPPETSLGFEKFGVYGARRALAPEEGGDILCGGERHTPAGFVRSGAKVRREDYVGALEAGVDEGLLFEDVEAGAGYFLGFKGVDERGFVNHRTAGGIDQEGGRLHAEELGGVEQAASVAVERHVE